jgi:hypothetical protein
VAGDDAFHARLELGCLGGKRLVDRQGSIVLCGSCDLVWGRGNAMHRRLLMVSGAFEHVYQGLLPLLLPPSSQHRCSMIRPYHWVVRPSWCSVLEFECLVKVVADARCLYSVQRVELLHRDCGWAVRTRERPSASDIDLPLQTACVSFPHPVQLPPFRPSPLNHGHTCVYTCQVLQSSSTAG